MHCADTSFLFALYRQQANSLSAIELFEEIGPPIVISALLAYEFRQAVRFHVFLRSRDATKGYLEAEGFSMLAQFQNDLESGVMIIGGANWNDVAGEAERLSEKYTHARGCRAFDLLHIAVALCWGASAFLSFDGLQREIAKTENLNVLPNNAP